ncbi:MAG: aspartate--tRNA ligase [Thermoanaerobaculia bacterium]|nr:aspartate--tRNA ligase [Thermoanaerobaculia bacterium]
MSGTGKSEGETSETGRTRAGTLRAEDVGKRVRLKGWIARRRDLGGLIFLNLRDRSGNAQVVIHPEDRPKVAGALDPVRLEWVVEVEGEVRRRGDDAVNPEMETGEVEVVADGGRILSRAEPLPLAIEGELDATEETRLRYRYLDLRRSTLQGNLRLRHEVTLEVRNYFDEQGFYEVETPILTRSTPEGARDYLVPSRIHPRSFYALPQSPQLFKQILMVSGVERYFQIARCFRDEDLRADRQPEFTQIDLELSFVEEDEVVELVEGLFERIFPPRGIPCRPPFRRIPYPEAMLRYGTDRPDLRFGLEIHDLSDLVEESEFRAFRGTVGEGGVVRGFAVPGAADASRSQAESWAELARHHGAQGVLTLKRRGGEAEFQVKNVLSSGELEGMTERLSLEEGGLALIVAAEEELAATTLGALRKRLARDFDLIPEDTHVFCWVTEFPLVAWDDEEDRWTSNHHPFTAPDPRDLELLEEDPGRVRSRAYDVVLDGVELGGGSIRIHERSLQERVFQVLGIDAEEARERFGFLLEALTYGAPPHGGIAFGLDRIVMLMAGASSIRDVIPFPKTTSATCLMTDAPAEVDPEQLEGLGIRFRSGE